jgi:hypothetical protein
MSSLKLFLVDSKQETTQWTLDNYRASNAKQMKQISLAKSSWLLCMTDLSLCAHSLEKLPLQIWVQCLHHLPEHFNDRVFLQTPNISSSEQFHANGWHLFATSSTMNFPPPHKNCLLGHVQGDISMNCRKYVTFTKTSDTLVTILSWWIDRIELKVRMWYRIVTTSIVYVVL